MRNAKTLLIALALLARFSGQAQGRVVINEYLPWPLNGCGVTSEFVELLNFGPGPINIGCYIITDGDYAITIPPNTILQPGQFYVIAGQDVVAAPCDNVDSTIHAHLNWNTCNCTNAPIPATGDGFLTDGGSASEQVVLLAPDLTVVDAVVRKLPAEPSSLITTSAVGGGCTSRTFDLDFMNIEYETIGESDGRGNSMARKTDGDCGWVKDSRQSANATNNTPGEVSSLDATFNITSFRACPPTMGSILIVINSGDMSQIFPMRYTLAYDSNNNHSFDFNDTYTTGIDSTPNSLAITGLAAGRYRIVIETRLGCNLTLYDFVILPCSSVLGSNFLWAGLQEQNGAMQLVWQAAANEQVLAFEIEAGNGGTFFETAVQVAAQSVAGTIWYSQPLPSGYRHFRVKMLLKNGGTVWSQFISVTGQQATEAVRLLANPVQDGMARLHYTAVRKQAVWAQVLGTDGRQAVRTTSAVQPGINLINIPVQNLPKGLYFISLYSAEGPLLHAPAKLIIDGGGR